MKDPAPGEPEDLRHRFDLHPLAAQDACREHERPKLNEYDDDLYALMDEVVDRYVPVLEQLQADLESIDEHIFAPWAARSNQQRLYTLKRKALVLEHAVGSMLQFAGKFQGGRVPVVLSAESIRARWSGMSW